ncbi:MAG: thioredoxin domain-containing protein [Balneolaceae bacterium]
MKRGLFLFTFIGLLFAGTAIAQESDNKITIVKYSDYQCPACKYFVPIEEQLVEEYGNEIEIVTKHFPLTMHEHAQLASRAVEAARKQGKYHEMHDMVFEGQGQWARGNAEGTFIGYAKSLDLDVNQFREDLNSADTQKIVMEDKQEGTDLNVNSTPTFFINGEKLERNPRTLAAFKAIIDKYRE